VEQGGKQISTLDLFGRNFVVLTGPEGGNWRDAACTVSQQLKVPIDVYQFDLGTAYGLMPQGAMMVRPDALSHGVRKMAARIRREGFSTRCDPFWAG
jgi:hypothetical protein